ncbi:hypothetical protein [Solirubrobacter deserti]|uniref:Uncharacterized protein n=1 Tax=Solirubrobacter deserti TaxID=2282478 RepID=A0ABT4RFM9_9ACTN|nr:hypothetical protein [Solirubrobacter deserti]MDA0137293.1 hypothetical protein [Solirubrobacter deserti]
MATAVLSAAVAGLALAPAAQAQGVTNPADNPFPISVTIDGQTYSDGRDTLPGYDDVACTPIPYVSYDFGQNAILYYDADGQLLKTAKWTEWSRISSYQAWVDDQKTPTPTATPTNTPSATATAPPTNGGGGNPQTTTTTTTNPAATTQPSTTTTKSPSTRTQTTSKSQTTTKSSNKTQSTKTSSNKTESTKSTTPSPSTTSTSSTTNSSTTRTSTSGSSPSSSGSASSSSASASTAGSDAAPDTAVTASTDAAAGTAAVDGAAPVVDAAPQVPGGSTEVAANGAPAGGPGTGVVPGAVANVADTTKYELASQAASHVGDTRLAGVGILVALVALGFFCLAFGEVREQLFGRRRTKHN